jgi:hypothetical protein
MITSDLTHIVHCPNDHKTEVHKDATRYLCTKCKYPVFYDIINGRGWNR